MTIVYRDSHEIDLDQLTTLLNAVGWTRRTTDRKRLAQFEPCDKVLARRRKV